MTDIQNLKEKWHSGVPLTNLEKERVEVVLKEVKAHNEENPAAAASLKNPERILERVLRTPPPAPHAWQRKEPRDPSEA